MKKILTVLLAAAMVLSMTACSSNSNSSSQASSDSSASSEKSYKVAFLTFTTEGDYWSYMFNLVKDDFAKEGATMDIISADGDAVRQVEQIENCVSQQYDLIVEIAVDPDAVADANKRAIEAGVPVFQFIKDSGKGNRTSFRGTNEDNVAKAIVDAAMDWVHEAFPDAADGSVNTIVVGGNSAGSETERYESLVKYAGQHSELNVIDTVRWETSQSYAQSATENEITKFGGNVQLMLVGSGEMALGVRTSIMAEGSMITDYSKFGIVSCDITQEAADAIRNAAKNEDVYRAAAVNGGDTVKNMQEMVDECMLILRGEPYEEEYYVDISVATADNLADFGY